LVALFLFLKVMTDALLEKGEDQSALHLMSMRTIFETENSLMHELAFKTNLLTIFWHFKPSSFVC